MTEQFSFLARLLNLLQEQIIDMGVEDDQLGENSQSPLLGSVSQHAHTRVAGGMAMARWRQ
ncbi:MAG: hypothetical protein ACYCY9_05325 [Thiobacillus sp.]